MALLLVWRRMLWNRFIQQYSLLQDIIVRCWTR